MSKDQVHIVMSPGLVLAAYRGDRRPAADQHARCITGAAVVTVDVRADLPDEIREDVESDFIWDDDQDTPVVDVPPEVLGSLADGSTRNRRAATEPSHPGGAHQARPDRKAR